MAGPLRKDQICYPCSRLCLFPLSATLPDKEGMMRDRIPLTFDELKSFLGITGVPGIKLDIKSSTISATPRKLKAVYYFTPIEDMFGERGFPPSLRKIFPLKSRKR
jgi:hypothetical protein